MTDKPVPKLPETPGTHASDVREPSKPRRRSASSKRRPAPVETKDGYAPGSKQKSLPTTPTGYGAKTVTKSNWLPHPRLGSRLTQDIGRITSQGVASDVQGILSGFHRLVSEYFAEDGESAFPCSVHRHPVNKNMCSKAGHSHVLLFHICDAVLSYYKFVNGEGTQEDYDKIEKVHYIASVGAMAFSWRGNDSHGYGFVNLKDEQCDDDRFI